MAVASNLGAEGTISMTESVQEISKRFEILRDQNIENQKMIELVREELKYFDIN